MDWQTKVGIGLAVVFGLLPFVVKSMPPWISWPGIAMGVALIAWGLISNHERLPFIPAIVIVLCCAGIAGSIGYIWEIRGEISHKKDDNGALPSILTLFSNELRPGVGISIDAFTLENFSVGSTLYPIDVYYKIIYDKISGTKFMSAFVPNYHIPGVDPAAVTYSVLYNLSGNYLEWMKSVEEKHWATMRDEGQLDNFVTKDARFSGRIYLYYETDLSLERLGELEKVYREHGASAEFRGTTRAFAVWGSVKRGEIKPLPVYVIKDGVPVREDGKDVPVKRWSPPEAISPNPVVEQRSPR